MIIPGIPDKDLRRHHWRYAPGRGGGHGLEHIPSGLKVCRDCGSGDKPFQVAQALVVELLAKLVAHGIITDETSTTQ